MTQQMNAMSDYIRELVRKPGLVIDENTPLVSSGLIDSMALVDLLIKLEELTQDAYTCRQSTAERHEHGRPDVCHCTARRPPSLKKISTVTFLHHSKELPELLQKDRAQSC